MSNENESNEFPPEVRALIRTVARLNPDCGEIGAGMLATLVAAARNIEANYPDRLAD